MTKASFCSLMAVATLAVGALACQVPVTGLLSMGNPPMAFPHTPTPSPAAPTPTPVVLAANYTNASTGVSVWYPEEWVCEEFVGQVVFASSAGVINGVELESGAAMMMTRTELTGSLTIEELLETTLKELYFDKIKISDPRARTIGGHEGLMVSVQGSPTGGDVSMMGFLAGVEHDGWGYLFMAASIRGEWSEYGPVLERMLGSVEFQHIEPVYSSPRLGLSIPYPEGWIYEAQGEQLVFATSEDIFSGPDFQSGAVMLIIGSELGDGETLEGILETILSELSSEDMLPGERGSRGIGGLDGIIIPFEGRLVEEVTVRGFVAAVEHGERGYLFVGFSAMDGWCEYEPSLLAMLDGVRFAEE
jgi:hypothetical protein